MASSRTRMMIEDIIFNNKQIASKMPDTAICYIHCYTQYGLLWQNVDLKLKIKTLKIKLYDGN